jgi:hypothetical protein
VLEESQAQTGLLFLFWDRAINIDISFQSVKVDFYLFEVSKSSCGEGKWEGLSDRNSLPPFSLINYDSSPRNHIWNSYLTPFSSCSPSGTSKPTHFFKASCDALFHSTPSFLFRKKSSKNTSQSMSVERTLVSNTRSTLASVDESGRASDSV